MSTLKLSYYQILAHEKGFRIYPARNGYSAVFPHGRVGIFCSDTSMIDFVRGY